MVHATLSSVARDELLDAVRVERAARIYAKARSKAALTIQRWWRGHASRRRLRAHLITEWLAKYGPAVAAPQGAGGSSLTAEEVAGGSGWFTPLAACSTPGGSRFAWTGLG